MYFTIKILRPVELCPWPGFLDRSDDNKSISAVGLRALAIQQTLKNVCNLIPY